MDYLTDTLLHIVVHAEELKSYILTGPDEFFGLLIPPPNQPFSSPESFAASPIEGLNPGRRGRNAPRNAAQSAVVYRALPRHTPGLLAFNVGTHGLNALPTDTSPLAESSTDAPTGPGLSWS